MQCIKQQGNKKTTQQMWLKTKNRYLQNQGYQIKHHIPKYQKFKK
jgi:hypothetical protein